MTDSSLVVWLIEPLLSVATMVIVKFPDTGYACASEVAVPARLWTDVPSPQLTEIELTVPSLSVLENVAVTVVPVFAGFGETPVNAMVGGWSLTETFVAAEPDPAAFVAVTAIVKVRVWTFPVEV